MPTVAQTFQEMQAHFNPAAAAGLDKTIQINLSGEQGGKWAIRIANQTFKLIPGGVDQPDLTLTMSDENWLALIERRLNPMTAFMMGKIKATGDLPLAMRVPNLFNMQ
jgi:putative sterol carrier protein